MSWSIGTDNYPLAPSFVKKLYGIKIAVNSYESLRDGDFDELVHFGTIPTAAQRDAWLRDSGIEKDKELQATILRKRQEQGLPQANVTTEQVREIVREEKKKST